MLLFISLYNRNGASLGEMIEEMRTRLLRGDFIFVYFCFFVMINIHSLNIFNTTRDNVIVMSSLRFPSTVPPKIGMFMVSPPALSIRGMMMICRPLFISCFADFTLYLRWRVNSRFALFSLKNRHCRADADSSRCCRDDLRRASIGDFLASALSLALPQYKRC